MELSRESAYEAHKARIEAELPKAAKIEGAALDAKQRAWGVLGWIKRGRGKKAGRDLVKRLDMVNLMARNPGWSL